MPSDRSNELTRNENASWLTVRLQLARCQNQMEKECAGMLRKEKWLNLFLVLPEWGRLDVGRRNCGWLT